MAWRTRRRTSSPIPCPGPWLRAGAAVPRRPWSASWRHSQKRNRSSHSQTDPMDLGHAHPVVGCARRPAEARPPHQRPRSRSRPLMSYPCRWSSLVLPRSAGYGLGRLDEGSKLHHLLLPRCVSSPRRCAAPPGPERRGRGTARPLLGVRLVLAFGAVADVPDVAVWVGERTAVPAPLQLRRGLEDLPAGLLGLVQNFVDAALAAHDVIEDDTAEAAALRARAHHVGEPVAAVEPDQRAAVRNEEHRDLVVVLDLPAQPFGIKPPGPLHVLDTEEDRTHVRFHALSPLGLGGNAHHRHGGCGPMTCASRFLTGWVTRFATHDAVPAGRPVKTQRQTTTPRQAGPKPGRVAPVSKNSAEGASRSAQHGVLVGAAGPRTDQPDRHDSPSGTSTGIATSPTS